MTDLNLIIGIGMVCAFILYIIFNIDSDDKLIKFMLVSLGLGVFLFLLLLIPKVALDNADYCSVEVNQTNTSMENITQYDYGRYCFTNPNTTALTFFNSVNLLIRIALAVTVIVFTIFAFKKIRGLQSSYRYRK